MPSVLSIEFVIPPLTTSYYVGRSYSHRLKRHLEKGDRRATDKINDHHGLCMNTIKAAHGVLKDCSVDELSMNVTKFVNIHDDIEYDSKSSTSHKTCEFQKKNSCGKFFPSKTTIQAPEKCLVKHATFPSSGKTFSLQDGITSELSTHGDNIKSNDPSGFRSISMPTSLKPVSAMKGSREKHGVVPPVKLTVKWAPEVYDPIPTSVSHVVTNNRSYAKHSKKNSKNKQKNGSKSSRGSKSKDKKQVVRKRGGNSSSGIGYKLEHEELLVDFLEHEPQSGGIDFHVGNPDRLCGGSFMKRYGSSLHLSSVAEAT
ncbi:hypothetical protein E3N88_13232 [Mikania micrantha]|uniref:Uncharacterized protein n=1 Tax=Mikania micrantha TaxID=192012 RepID=A0A5N6P865_9ASTR|nr:hypothetical protein E3N88_13232 [Mikania micrantha]